MKVSPPVYLRKCKVVSALSPSTATPYGDLAFSVDGMAQPALPLEDGRLSLAILALSPGNHVITAAFAGSARFQPSAASPLIQMVAYPLYLPVLLR